MFRRTLVVAVITAVLLVPSVIIGQTEKQLVDLTVPEFEKGIEIRRGTVERLEEEILMMQGALLLKRQQLERQKQEEMQKKAEKDKTKGNKRTETKPRGSRWQGR